MASSLSVNRDMRQPTTKGTLVTLHDGRVVQAVPAMQTPGERPSCKCCVGLANARCGALMDMCGGQAPDQFVFIDNTPEAMAEYVVALLGESP